MKCKNEAALSCWPCYTLTQRTYGSAAGCLADVNVVLHFVCFVHSAVAGITLQWLRADAPVVSTCALSCLCPDQNAAFLLSNKSRRLFFYSYQEGMANEYGTHYHMLGIAV